MSLTGEDDYPTLSKDFDNQLKIFTEIENSDLPTNSKELQNKILSSIKALEDMTIKVSYLGVFSRNESIEEISTTSLKFLMLPVLLGSLSQKCQNREREQILNMSMIYFKDFLERCSHYQLTSYTNANASEETESSNTNSKIPDLQTMNRKREEKIARYKKKNSLKEKLSQLKKSIENLSHDEDVVREYFLTMIKHFIIISLEELEAINMELEIVKTIKQIKPEDTLPQKESSKSLKPFLITKDDVQKKVFGAGYPSLPVMSVEEFYEMRVKDGWFPCRDEVKHKSCETAKHPSSASSLEENKETTIENEDDDEETERLRHRDEWRDDHRIGWGNRYNRS